MKATIDFFEIDPDTWEDIPVGELIVDGDTITASVPFLLGVAAGKGATPAEIVEALSDWSNGYLRSQLREE